MAIVGSAPHPRILFVGWAEDDPGLQEMTELIPTWKIWDGNLQSIRWADWDALVSCQKFDYPDPFSHPTQHRMPVLAFPHSTLPMCRTANEQLMSVYPDALKQPSTEMEINDILPAPLKQLVQREMIPWLQKLPERPLLEHTYSTPSGFCTRGFQTDMDGNSPYWFVRDADHVMIAGAYRTRHNESVWWIPFIPDYPAEWLSAAMEAWSTELPDQFPPRSPWRTQPRWMTRDELRTTEEITQKEAALRALTSERQEEIAQLQSKLSGDAAQADAGLRRLLTAQGAELEDAVADALRSLGFDVVAVDGTIPKGQARKEDFRASLPESGTALIEVKGYKEGAKQSDLLKIAKYATLYESEQEKAPERQWYICNQFLDVDPNTRQEILAGADDFLGDFAKEGGAVIDTKELFLLVRQVEDGQLSPEGARTALWNSPMRFVAPKLATAP